MDTDSPDRLRDTIGHQAILSLDTTAEAEYLQIQAWRRMPSAEKAAIVGRATRAAIDLTLAGIRQRHPGASDRECLVRLAAVRLGPTLTRAVYPDASEYLGPET